MNEILKQYNNFSETYTDNFEIQDEVGNKRFYQFLSSVDLEGKQILDIGCGDGSDLVNFEKMGAFPTGIDPSEKFVNSGKRKVSSYDYLIRKRRAVAFSRKNF